MNKYVYWTINKPNTCAAIYTILPPLIFISYTHEYIYIYMCIYIYI